MEYKTIRFDKKEGIAHVALNRPEALNTLNMDLAADFLDVLERCGRDDDIKVVILTGEGRSFCAGADVKELKSFVDAPDKSPREWIQVGVRHLNLIILGMRHLKKPIIGAINGVATGAGFSFVMACDIVIASERARFGEAYTAIGLVPDGGASYFLPMLVGYHKAMELILTSDIIDAQQALRLNLVNNVVPHESLMETAEKLAARLAAGASLALSRSKELVNRSFTSSLETQLECEAEYQIQSSVTEDHQEGLAAFFEKRRPVFKGR